MLVVLLFLCVVAWMISGHIVANWKVQLVKSDDDWWERGIALYTKKRLYSVTIIESPWLSWGYCPYFGWDFHLGWLLVMSHPNPQWAAAQREAQRVQYELRGSPQ
jgi:hypothetical protein